MDPARVSIASTSTATTSASSATLVSSETISSESASSASVRTNSDVGSPSPFYRLKASYQPAKPLSEDVYKPAGETWAQRAQKASRRYVMPPPMDIQENIELERESRLTTPAGARGTTGAGRDEHWRGGKTGQANGVEESAALGQGSEEGEGKTSFVHESSTTKARVPSGKADSSSNRGDDESDGGIQSQGVGAETQGPADNFQSADDAAEGDPALRKIEIQTSRSQRDSANTSVDPRSNVDNRDKGSETEGGNATQGEEQKDEGSAQKTTKYTVDEGARSAGSGDYKNPFGERDETIQTGPFKEEQVEESALGGSGELKSAEANSIEASDHNQLTVMSKQGSRSSRQNSRLVAERNAKAKAEDSVSEKLKAEELRGEKSSTQDTPPKISWADDEDDEWAGFESLSGTTPEFSKEGEERKGG